MTEESEDVKQLREKLKAIEEQRKRDLAKKILFNNFINERGHFVGFSSVDRALNAMLEFHETMKKTGI